MIARRCAATVAMSLACTVGSLSAQGTTTCTASPTVPGSADLCSKGADLFAFLVPQFGTALAGGNSTIGDAGTLGGLGHFSAAVRATAVSGLLPSKGIPLTLQNSTATGSDFGAARTVVPMATVDVALGLFKGLPLGLTNVGGVDLLLSGAMIPAVDKGTISLRPQGGAFALGYGVRVGALQESALVPGLSASFLRRKVPTLDADYVSGNDSLRVRSMTMTANSLRLVVSKRLLLLGVAAGVGQDVIDGATGFQAIVNELVAGSSQRSALTFPSLHERVTRSTAFVNASFSLLVARVVVEVGQSKGGAARSTVNSFGGKNPNDGYLYGSVGVTTRF